MKTVLVDDEQKSVNALRTLLERYCPEVEVAGTAGSVAQAIEVIKNTKPELVFMDILMPDGTGFDVLERCEDRNFEVIFVTAFEEHSLRAFHFSALHYLLKPVNFEDLQEAVSRFKPHVSKEDLEQRNQRVEVAKTIFTRAASENIVLSSSEGFLVVKISDIVRCEADSNYTKVIFSNGKSFLASRNLLYFEELLADLYFVRIHHKNLVNLAHVKRYVKGRGGYLEMTDGAEVEVSARKKDEFMERLAVFARG